MLNGLDSTQQWEEFERVGTDPRPRVSSGWPELDGMLHRSSFGPGTFVILGGRMHTRKTAVTVNLIANMLKQDVPVGLMGLDEAIHMYVVKLASVFTGRAHTELDTLWGTSAIAQVKHQYVKDASKLTVSQGFRPSFDDMTRFLEEAEARNGERPRAVFIDYLTLLERDKFAGKDVTRIPRLCEELQVWTSQNEVVTFALHQVGRQDDTSKRNHGDMPVSPEQLMYGGEQAADIILATYRPANNRIGNLTQDQALDEGVDQVEWTRLRDRVFAHRADTFLQLLKNRPGTKLDITGIKLQSLGDSQKMEVAP